MEAPLENLIGFIDQTLIKIWVLCTNYLIHLDEELSKYPDNKELLDKREKLIDIMKSADFSLESKMSLGNVSDGLRTIFSATSQGQKFLKELDKVITEGENLLTSQGQFIQSRASQYAPDYDYNFKILVLGDTNSGKSSLIRRFTDNQFTESRSVWREKLDLKIKKIHLDGTAIQFQIWDVNVRNKSEFPSKRRGAHGVIIVYDTTVVESFSNVQHWLTMKNDLSLENTPVLLVGNKCDLLSERKISTEDAREFADQLSIPFLEVSAKDGVNIEEAFVKLAKIIKAPLEEENEHNVFGKK